MTEKSSNNESIRGSTTCDADGFNAKSTVVYEGSKKWGQCIYVTVINVMQHGLSLFRSTSTSCFGECTRTLL